MLENSKEFRPNNPILYPNYHQGKYFEEYFFDRFTEEYKGLEINGYKYIPVFWTNCYMDIVFGSKKKYEIQKFLNELDVNTKYFTISQHDDCVNEILPKNTKVFSMGGNKVGENIIPIPLICSPINKIKKNKDILISFVGSLTHPSRTMLFEKYKNNKNFYFNVKDWELTSDKCHIDNFIEITSRSIFTLSPRGYGKTSFRMYEAMQLDSIPIYIYDNEWLPFNDEIYWDNLIVKVHVNEIDNIEEIIKNCNLNKMLSYKDRIYHKFFTYDGLYNQIIKKLKKITSVR